MFIEARHGGICQKRRELYSQCFDEVNLCLKTSENVQHLVKGDQTIDSGVHGAGANVAEGRK